MSEWKEYRLGDIAEPQKNTYIPNKEDDYSYIGLEHIEQGTLRLIGTGSSKEISSQKFIFQKGDVLFGKLRVYFRKVVQPNFSGICSTDIWVFRAKKNVSQTFLFYFLANWDFINTADGGEGGTRMPRADWNFLKTTKWIIPPLPEQRAIASILSSLDDKIDLLHRQNATLEKMAETLFRQWFVEEAKEEWEENELGNFISIKHGFAFKGENISPDPTNQILVTPGNFKIGGGFKSDKFKYYTKEDFPKEYVFNTGDLIVTMTDLSVDGDTLGYSALVPANFENEIFLHNQRVGKVEYKKSISKFFLYYLMKTGDYQWYILSGASGTSIRHTSPTSICSYCFKLPTIDKLSKFENICSILHEKIGNNQSQIRTLTRLRDTLLPKLMSGEIRIK